MHGTQCGQEFHLDIRMTVHYFAVTLFIPACFGISCGCRRDALLKKMLAFCQLRVGLMLHHHPQSVANQLHVATWLWLGMLASIVSFAAVVSGFLWYLADRSRAYPHAEQIGYVGALAGALGARWFPRSSLISRRFDFSREDSRLKAYRQALIIGLALAECGALTLLVSMLLSQMLLPAVLFFSLPLWSMLMLRPSPKSFESFCQWHLERSR